MLLSLGKKNTLLDLNMPHFKIINKAIIGLLDKIDMTFSLPTAALNTKELDVYIKRNQESGFGFRVLGGEGPDQPVRSQPGVTFNSLGSLPCSGAH